jgi:DsbC/DsbD-like thiol-disulfide interchange protein
MWSGLHKFSTSQTLLPGVSNRPLRRSVYCRSIRLLLLVLLCQLWLIQPRLAASNDPREKHLSLELISEQDALVPSGDLWVGIRFSLQDGWHTYWMNPGDSGEPARIEWRLPPGFKAGAVQWPEPERLLHPPFADYGYQHEVLLMTVLSAPSTLKLGQNVELDAGVRYLVCREVCIPGRKQLHLTLPVKDRATQTSASQSFENARKKLPRAAPAQWRLSAVEVGDELVLSLTTMNAALAPEFFPLQAEQIENAAPQKVTAKPGGIRLHLIKSKHLLKPISRLQGILVVSSGRAYQVNIPVSQSFGRAHPGPQRSDS